MCYKTFKFLGHSDTFLFLAAGFRGVLLRSMDWIGQTLTIHTLISSVFYPLFHLSYPVCRTTLKNQLHIHASSLNISLCHYATLFYILCTFIRFQSHTTFVYRHPLLRSFSFDNLYRVFSLHLTVQHKALYRRPCQISPKDILQWLGKNINCSKTRPYIANIKISGTFSRQNPTDIYNL